MQIKLFPSDWRKYKQLNEITRDHAVVTECFRNPRFEFIHNFIQHSKMVKK